MMLKRDELVRVVQDLQQGLENANAAIGRVLSDIANSPVWGALAAVIRSGMDALMQKAREFFTAIEEVFTKPGDETALLDTGQKWHDQVSVPANQLAGDLNLDKLGVDDYWGGLAGKAYETSVPAHSGAFTNVRIVADGIQTSLTSMANEVRNFFIAVIAAAAAAVVGVIALAALVFPPAIPPAIAVASTAIGTAVAMLAAAITGIVGFMNGARSQLVAMQQNIDRLKTPEGATAWPTANQELANQGGWQVADDI